MKRSKVFQLLRFLLSIVIGAGLFFSSPTVNAQDEYPGGKIAVGPLMDDRAPDIKLKTLDGETFQLNRWIGKKPFVIVFYVTWCSRCKGEIPTIKKIQQKYAGENLGLITINANFKDNLDKALLYRKKHDLPYTILFDEAGQTAETYMVLGVPMILMVDRSGIIRYRSSRFPTDLDKAVKHIMQ
jgi:peroxiredoxin